ncbi:MAG: hypothetical protein JJT94_11470 [Bernardetiaceae bacterium]|nr:hypothetical protein [Bernardetiaceae bacterium]
MHHIIISKLLAYSSSFVLVVMLFWVGLSACEPKEELLSNESVRLRFSSDTISFDTLFTTLGSFTKRFKIYNPSNRAVEITKIGMTTPSSIFQLIINGQETERLESVRLRGRDSLLVLLQTRLDATDANLPFLIEDFIRIVQKDFEQRIPVRAWGQNARFLRNEVIDGNVVWDSNLPYVIEGSVLVRGFLRLLPNVEVYFMPGSAFLVEGTLRAESDVERPIRFTSIRNDPAFRNQIGQWFGIIFGERSRNNILRHVRIRNATIGIRFGNPSREAQPALLIENSIIENMAETGLLCLNSQVRVENTLIHNCLNQTVTLLAGGDYEFAHCTFANYGFNFLREEPSFVASNRFVFQDNRGAEVVLEEPLLLNMSNTIVWGSLREELFFVASEATGFETIFSHNIFKTENISLDINNNQISTANDFLSFKNPREGDFQLDSLSPAQDAGASLGIMFDLEMNPRSDPPDIGAYERIE